MIKKLLQLYPDAITGLKPNTDPQYTWLKDEIEDSYIGIPKAKLTKDEYLFLLSYVNGLQFELLEMGTCLNSYEEEIRQLKENKTE